MLNALSAEALLGSVRLALTLVHPDGDIFYENELARDQLFRIGAKDSLRSIITLPFRWQEVLAKLKAGEPVMDESMMIRSESSDMEVCYLSALPQYAPSGELDSVLCIWSSRRNAQIGRASCRERV